MHLSKTPKSNLAYCLLQIIRQNHELASIVETWPELADKQRSRYRFEEGLHVAQEN